MVTRTRLPRGLASRLFGSVESLFFFSLLVPFATAVLISSVADGDPVPPAARAVGAGLLVVGFVATSWTYQIDGRYLRGGPFGLRLTTRDLGAFVAVRVGEVPVPSGSLKASCWSADQMASCRSDTPHWWDSTVAMSGSQRSRRAFDQPSSRLDLALWDRSTPDR